MRLTQKLPLIIVCIAIAASLVTGLLALSQFERELRKSELSQLTALAEARAGELKRYLTTLQVTLSIFSRNPAVSEALAEFAGAYQSLSLITDGPTYLKTAFGRDHVAPVGKGEVRWYAQYYRQVHKEFHPWFVGNLKDRGLYDVFLIDTNGNVIYSAKKEADFASNLKRGAMRKTGLGEVFDKILRQPNKIQTAVSDLEIYQPSGNLASGFIAAPIFSRHGNWMGVVALQIPGRRLNDILSVVSGMGKTGETYLVGEDRLMRSQSRFIEGSTILKIKVDNASVDRAFSGKTGRHLTTGYRGIPVFSAYRPVEFGTVRWVLLAEIDEQEVISRVEKARVSMFWIIASIAVLLLVVGGFNARRISVPIRNVSDAMTKLAGGDLGATVSGKRRADEIGNLVGSFETLRKNELKRRQLEIEVTKQHAIAQAALDNMGRGLVMVDKYGKVQARNQDLAEIFPVFNQLLDQDDDYHTALLAMVANGRGDAVSLKQIQDLVAENQPAVTEVELVDRFIEISHTPLPDGGFVQTGIDTTARRAAAAEIAAKEEILRVAMENMDQGLIMVDKFQMPVARNRKYLEMFPHINAVIDKYGNYAEAVKNFATETGLVTKGLDHMQEKISATEASTFEVVTQGHHIEVRHVPLPGGGFVRTCTDVTERIQAEAEIAAKEELLRAALNNMSDGIFLLDEDLRFRMFNEKYLELTSVPKKLVAVGSPIRPVLEYAAGQGFYGPGDIKEQVEQRLVAFGDPAYLEVEVKAGENRINALRKSGLPDGGAVVVISDITERKRADENIRQILEASPTGVVIARTDGTLLFCNSRLAEMFGTTKEDFLSRKAVNYWVDQDQQQAIYQELADKGHIGNQEVRMRRIDSEEFWGLYSGLNFNYLGIPARMGWFFDITQRKAAEDDLKDAYSIINESVEYASQIQRSALPMTELLEHYFEDHFVIWEPRDTVGGDFYWQIPMPDGCLLAVADCTGHGVPGAFVTLIASGAIRHALSLNPEGEPDLIINGMNHFIKEVLAQYTDDNESDDGLELGVCRIYESSRQIDFAGARFSLWHWSNGNFQEVRGDKTGVGYCSVPITMNLTRHRVSANEDSLFYLFSDGMVDQIGGPKRRAFGKRRVLAALAEQLDAPLHIQAAHVMQVFKTYQGEEKRRDDITMVGFRF